MKNLSKEKQQQILDLNETLENAKLILKKEFVGIDIVIDQIADMCRAWYVFPEFQLKPTVINLWGMTGVGKTSLVKRFCELISFSSKLIAFDLGSSASENWAFQSNIRTIAELHEGKPLIIVLDEFQHAKTLNRMGEELDRPSARMVWEIIDSGKFTSVDYPYGLSDLSELATKLREILSLGVIVENGKIKDGLEIYYKVFYKGMVSPMENEPKKSLKTFRESEDEVELFVPSRSYDTILSLLPNKFPTRLTLWEELKKMNGKETILFLKNLYEIVVAPKKIDCSKSLIFVLGNLDEAYRMTKNMSVDMEADNFHENSLNIKLPDIKRALLVRFRAEQLSRLGNSHIIYPAFNNRSYQELIERYLARITEATYSSIGFTLVFDESISTLLYKEGVYPTQGTRPLFSTINNLIETKLPKMITSIILSKEECDRLVLSNEGDRLIAVCYLNGKRGMTLEEKIELTLGKLRISKRNDKQAVTAVHESGHAVVHCALFHKVPERIVSVSTDTMYDGFITTRNKKGFRSKIEMMNEISVLLAGYAAEIMIYGADYLTAGASQDFTEATTMASNMVKELGMGNRIGAYHVRAEGTNDYLHKEDSITEEIEMILDDALIVANETLETNRMLLLKLSDYLSDERSMEKEHIGKFVMQYSSLSVEFDEAVFETIHYRRRLKELVNEETSVSLRTA